MICPRCWLPRGSSCQRRSKTARLSVRSSSPFGPSRSAGGVGPRVEADSCLCSNRVVTRPIGGALTAANKDAARAHLLRAVRKHLHRSDLNRRGAEAHRKRAPAPHQENSDRLAPGYRSRGTNRGHAPPLGAGNAEHVHRRRPTLACCLPSIRPPRVSRSPAPRMACTAHRHAPARAPPLSYAKYGQVRIGLGRES